VEASGGAITGNISKKKNARLPGNSTQAKTRAAGRAMATEMAATTAAIHKLVKMAGLISDAGDARYTHARELQAAGSNRGQNQFQENE